MSSGICGGVSRRRSESRAEHEKEGFREEESIRYGDSKVTILEFYELD